MEQVTSAMLNSVNTYPQVVNFHQGTVKARCQFAAGCTTRFFSLTATSLGHSVVTLEMCQELAVEEDPMGSAD